MMHYDGKPDRRARQKNGGRRRENLHARLDVADNKQNKYCADFGNTAECLFSLTSRPETPCAKTEP